MSIVTKIGKGIQTFKRGGVHPPEHKDLSRDRAIEPLEPQKLLYIPLRQHIGAPCQPLVKKGERVLLGQVIARSDAFVSAPIHASVSGKVKTIELRPHPGGGSCTTVIIENDNLEEWDESVRPDAEIATLSPDLGKDYLQAVREAGLVGLGGAAFPTHVKLSPPADKKIDVLLINGCECEPYLTSDYRMMVEEAALVLHGARILGIILGVRDIKIAIEDNKPEAIASMREAIEREDPSHAGLGEAVVIVCETKYPQGGERQLIGAVLGKEVPTGGLPMDVGAVVMNIGTCRATTDAITQRRPLIERVVTVTGTEVAHPKNLRVRVGAPFSGLLDFCGYDPTPGGKLLMGGPMMGVAQSDTEAPVIKSTSGIVALSPEEVGKLSERPCLRCGHCVQVCPMGLMPSSLAVHSEYDNLEPLKKLGIADCIECGSCDYVCSARRHLVQRIRLAKAKISQMKSK